MIGRLILSVVQGPYLLTRLVDHLYHIILLPGHLAAEELHQLGRQQAAANRLDTCLVVPQRGCISIQAAGREHDWEG